MPKPIDAKTLDNHLLCKITAFDNNHNGYIHKTGFNMLKGRFSPHKTSVSGGFYYSKAKYILYHLAHGINLRIVNLKEVRFRNDFKIVQDDDKYRSNMFDLGEPMSLSDHFKRKYGKNPSKD